MSTALLDLKNIYLRQATFQFELLDSSNNFQGVLAVEASSAPTISHDTSRSINRTINGLVVDPKIAGEVNPYTDRVRPTVQFSEGPVWPLGIYLFGSSSVLETSMLPVRTGALVDQTFIVDQPIEFAITFGTGSVLTDSIGIVLSQVGDFDYVIESNPAVVGETPMTWAAGTSALEIVNEICKTLGYYPLYFNHLGIGQVRSSIDTSAATPTLTYESGGRIYDRSLVRSDALLEVPNRYIVVDTSAVRAPIVGIYDVPPSLPHSFDHRGFHLREQIPVQGLASAHQATLAAATFAQRDARQGTASFSGPPDPRHDSYDLLWVDGNKYLEVGWTLPLVEGSDMQHNLILVVG